MKIQIVKLFQASLLKMAPAYASPELVREAELAREKAWHDAYLKSGGIGF